MSDHGHAGAGDQGGSSDAVNYGKVIGVGVGSLVIFALSIWWAAAIWHGAKADAEAKAGPAKEFDTHQAEIGIVDQVQFSADGRLLKWRRDRKLELERYGWVDKAKGVVRIPIEAAMHEVVGGAMPAGAPR
ncbi:MAG TPA: hypothetical protein VGK52_17245 [Polyangia bacterium]|jgi:hypothetical protein